MAKIKNNDYEILNETEEKTSVLEEEIQRLKSVIRAREEENMTLGNKFREYQDQVNRSEVSKSNELTFSLTTIRNENEDLKMRLRQANESGSNINR